MNFAVLARDEALRIGKRPVEIGVPANVDTATIDLDKDRATVGQGINVVDSQN